MKHECIVGSIYISIFFIVNAWGALQLRIGFKSNKQRMIAKVIERLLILVILAISVVLWKMDVWGFAEKWLVINTGCMFYMVASYVWKDR